jgi:hypothetical protein
MTVVLPTRAQIPRRVRDHAIQQVARRHRRIEIHG